MHSAAEIAHYRSLTPAQRVLEAYPLVQRIEIERLGPPSEELLPVYRQILEQSEWPKAQMMVLDAIKQVEGNKPMGSAEY